jgi:hypothetical protein
VRQFEIVGLVETRIEERSWKKIEKLLLKEYKRECQGAKRGKKKGRAAERNFGIYILGLAKFMCICFTTRNPKARRVK